MVGSVEALIVRAEGPPPLDEEPAPDLIGGIGYARKLTTTR